MADILKSKEKEVIALHTQVKGLQSTVQGADGKITLLQFQLQKAKRVTAAAAVLTSSPTAVCTDVRTLDRLGTLFSFDLLCGKIFGFNSSLTLY